MTSPELNQQPFYSEIFNGFVGLAAFRGTINYDPLDPAMAPGNDGTLTADRQRAFSYIYEASSEGLPQSVQDTGIDKLTVKSYTSQILNYKVWPERVAIEVHEITGVSKLFMFQKEAGVITSSDVSIYDDNEEYQEIGVGLSDDERDAILIGMLQGERHWLEQDGPVGEVARAIDFGLTFREGQPDIDEIDTLRMILAAFQP